MKNSEEYYFQWGESQSGVISSISMPYEKLSRLIGSGEWQCLLLSEKRTTSTYITRSFENAAREYAKAFLEPSFRDEFLAKTRQARQSLQALFEQTRDKPLSNASNNELAAILKQFCALVFDVTFYFYLSQQEFTETPKLELEKHLRTHFPAEKTASVLAGLLAISELDILKREELDLIKLALAGFDAAKLEKHSLDYAILFYNSYSKKANVSFLEQRAKQLQVLGKEKLEEKKKKIIGEAKQAKIRQEKLLGQINDANVTRLAVLLHDLGVDRLEMKNAWAGAEYRFLALFQEISRRTGIPFNELMGVYRPEDIEKALLEAKKVSLEEAKERKKIYAYQYHGGKHEFLSGQAALELAQKLIPHHFRRVEASEVRGLIASPGLARGTARVIKVVGIDELQKDLQQFKQGEVLVTTMTQPNMVLLAQKACAIVTNEGGITSHAAVLSREFKIPCVVGCEVATRAIKTGDFVEVDAERGIVRVIKRASK